MLCKAYEGKESRNVRFYGKSLIRAKESFLGVEGQSAVGRLWSVIYSIFHDIDAKKMICPVSVSCTEIITVRRYIF